MKFSWYKAAMTDRRITNTMLKQHAAAAAAIHEDRIAELGSEIVELNAYIKTLSQTCREQYDKIMELEHKCK